MDTSSIRKRRVDSADPVPNTGTSEEIDLPTLAAITYTAEDGEHPIEHLFDGQFGRGATFWASDRPGVPAVILFEFLEPQSLSRMVYEVEELDLERTQEMHMEASSDNGARFTRVFVQGYNFSPAGSTYQCESLRFELRHATHVRLTIVPTGGVGRAALTSVRLFS